MITEKEWSGRLAFSVGERHLRKLSTLADEAAQIAEELLEAEIADRKQPAAGRAAVAGIGKCSDGSPQEVDAYEKGWRNAHTERLAPTWTIACSDGTKLKTGNIDDVLGFENASDRSATGLQLRSGSPTFFEVKIFLSDEDENNFRYSIVGPDHKVLYFSEKVAEFENSVRTGYQFLYRYSDLTMGATLGALIIPILSYSDISSSGQDIWGELLGTALAGAIFGVVAFGFPLSLIKKFYSQWHFSQ